MNRRTFLAALAAGSLAGCTSPPGGSSTPEERLRCADDVSPNPRGYAPGVESRPSIHYDARNTGYDPERRGPAGCVRHRWTWQYSVDDVSPGPGMYTSPVVAGGTVYLGDESPYYADDAGDTPDNNSVVALDAKTGDEQWRLDAGFPAANTPTLHDDALLLPGDGELTAVNTSARTVRWARDLVSDPTDANQETFQPPVVTEGVVYTAGQTADVFALDAATGEVLWRFTAPGMDPADIPDEAADGVRRAKRIGEFHTPIAVAGDTLYASTFGDAVHALDRHTGERRWTYRLPLLTEYDRPLAPAVADGEVYVATDAGLLYVLDGVTGQERWNYTEKRFADGMAAGVDDTHVYVTAGESSPETHLHAIHRETHEVVWKTFVGRVNTGPAIDQGRVYVGQGSILLAVDKRTGAEQWWFDLSTGTYAAPAIANGAVFMADANGYVYGLW